MLVECLRLLPPAYVARAPGDAPEAAQCPNRCLQRLRITAADCDIGPLFQERLGNGASDSPAASCDDRQLALEICHRSYLGPPAGVCGAS